ncbi:unnamed protein product, partial [Hapterophycus canaliculatus]
TGPQEFETRKVKLAATNETMASITEGLEPGETAVLNLRQHLTLMDLPEIVAEDNSDMIALSNETPPSAGPESSEEAETKTVSRPGPGGRPGGGGAGRRPGGGPPSGKQRPGAPGRKPGSPAA